jgi:hypothetical protein
MSQDDNHPVIILYEVFTGTLPDGTQVMVQTFRKKGTEESMLAQVAFRKSTWESWGPPTRLDDRHQVAPFTEAPA